MYIERETERERGEKEKECTREYSCVKYIYIYIKVSKGDEKGGR